MVISVINWLMAARKAMISARSGTSGCTTGGSCNVNSSSHRATLHAALR